MLPPLWTLALKFSPSNPALLSSVSLSELRVWEYKLPCSNWLVSRTECCRVGRANRLRCCQSSEELDRLRIVSLLIGYLAGTRGRVLGERACVAAAYRPAHPTRCHHLLPTVSFPPWRPPVWPASGRPSSSSCCCVCTASCGAAMAMVAGTVALAAAALAGGLAAVAAAAALTSPTVPCRRRPWARLRASSAPFRFRLLTGYGGGGVGVVFVEGVGGGVEAGWGG